jgi:hypothetical protein
MKKYILLSLALLLSISINSQEKEHLSVFETDTTWIKEIIEFPIGFAQEIKYEGFEDLRFPQGWSKEESPNFWSYVWAWSINNKKTFTISELEQNIQYYFDGLLGLDFYKIDDKPQPKTNTVFIKQDSTHFIGKVKTIDTRYTKKPMTLHVQAESHYCKQVNIAIIVFRFSPQPFENNVWNRLKSVALKDAFCD